MYGFCKMSYLYSFHFNVLICKYSIVSIIFKVIFLLMNVRDYSILLTFHVFVVTVLLT